MVWARRVALREAGRRNRPQAAEPAALRDRLRHSSQPRPMNARGVTAQGPSERLRAPGGAKLWVMCHKPRESSPDGS